MIVMKFGGSSVGTGEALARLAQIVKSRLADQPIVVVSAMGCTTNRLLELSSEAERGHSYFAWKQLKELQEYHLTEAEKVVSGDAAEWLDTSVRKHFRDLHLTMLEIADEGRELTPALRDEIAAYGERISSEIVTAALHSAGVPSVHLDARQVIVTDDRHTQAEPLYWQTYARLRRAIPRLAGNRVVVMGGFIGSTESGVTTTLGRGGSDLTATLVGASLAAEEIQIWKDVDGMLTCDPRVCAGGLRLKSISYEEASAIASSGAKILHPTAVQPAIRQRIPIVLRNARRPELDGTRITAAAAPCSNPVKSIACKQNLTVLEIRTDAPQAADALIASLRQLCERKGAAPEFVAHHRGVVYFGVKSTGRFHDLQMEMERCVEVRLRPDCAVLSLVGAGIAADSTLPSRALAVLKEAVVCQTTGLVLSLIVPQAELKRSVELLHRELFRTVDPTVFVGQASTPVLSATRSSSDFTVRDSVEKNLPRGSLRPIDGILL
jgi:aspartate kinase